MAASIADHSAFTLSVAIGLSKYILKPLLDFLEEPAAAARDPVIKAAVFAVGLIAVAYTVAAFLFHIHVATGSAELLSPASLRRFAGVFFAMACLLIFAVVCLLIFAVVFLLIFTMVCFLIFAVVVLLCAADGR